MHFLAIPSATFDFNCSKHSGGVCVSIVEGEDAENKKPSIIWIAKFQRCGLGFNGYLGPMGKI